MARGIFVNYRRDDARDVAARIRDRLAATFGNANVLMDVDYLKAGQRFDEELEKALSETAVFLALIGPRWAELLAERQHAPLHPWPAGRRIAERLAIVPSLGMGCEPEQADDVVSGREHPICPQTSASSRVGPPVAPLILGAPTTRVAPRGGTPSRLAMHSRPQRPEGSQA